MLDLQIATTLEIQRERDNCSKQIQELAVLRARGEIEEKDAYEEIKYFDIRYVECLQRLMDDFLTADKLAGDLVRLNSN